MKIKKNELIYIIFLVIFLLLSGSTLNELKISIPTEYGVTINEIQDEYHTLFIATRELLGDVNSVTRVGPFSRTTVKILSPLGVFYMNNKLGGEHHVTPDNTHDYSGYSYLNRNFINFQNLYENPNIQNYRLGILFARNSFFIGILILISCSLFFNDRKLSSGFILLSILSSVAYQKASITLYTDFSNLLLLSIFFLVYLTNNNNRVFKNLTAFFLAAAFISNGLSNIIFLPLLFTIVKFKKFKYIPIYFLSFIFFVFILNINELQNPIIYLDSQLWNFYHYQTGHYLIEPVGFPILKKILRFSFPWAGAFFLVIFYKYLDIQDRNIFKVLCITQILIILSSIQLRVFTERNFAGLIIIGIFITTLIIKGLEKNLKIIYSNYFILGILIIFAIFPYLRNNNFNYRIENSINEIGCESLIAINTNISEIKIKNAKYANVEIVEIVEAPEYFKSLEELIQPYDCLLVRDTFESKNIATFVAPNLYKLGNRTNNFYLYYK